MQTNSIARSGNVQPQERFHQNIHADGTQANSHPVDSLTAQNVSVQEGGGRMFKFVVSGPKPQRSVFSTVTVHF
jgi:hypothetical protein